MSEELRLKVFASNFGVSMYLDEDLVQMWDIRWGHILGSKTMENPIMETQPSTGLLGDRMKKPWRHNISILYMFGIYYIYI